MLSHSKRLYAVFICMRTRILNLVCQLLKYVNAISVQLKFLNIRRQTFVFVCAYMAYYM